MATRSAAYNPAEIARAPGMVHTQERAMFLNTFMSTVPRPPLRLWVSIQPRAMPPPTRAMTWQWVVEVGMPRKVQPITTSEADTTTMKPREGVMGVILVPMVMMTRLPNMRRPTPIPSPPQAISRMLSLLVSKVRGCL